MVEQDMSSSSPSSSSQQQQQPVLQGGSLSLDHELFMWSANSWINSPLPARVAAAVASSNNCSCSSRCSSSRPQWVTGGVHNEACDLIARIATPGRIWSSGEWSPCTVAAPRDCCCLKDWPLQRAVWFSIHYHHGDTSVACSSAAHSDANNSPCGREWTYNCCTVIPNTDLWPRSFWICWSVYRTWLQLGWLLQTVLAYWNFQQW